ncbi:ribosomal RNA small subunit methyltransferase A, partial [Candidatus Micrarchaeota archaeon]|nr:ribosomal RNA small subunit methyltransferase A [Candidatus Micrarchaeota archaeon]
MPGDLFTALNSQMVRHRFRANPKFGQNFVVDPELIVRAISAAELKKTDSVLEIGAGSGFLTRALLEHAKVTAVETDKTLCELLQEDLGKNKKFKLICGDFIRAKLPKFTKVVSFPPYTISSGIIYKLIEHDFKLAVLVFQREFAQKLTAEPGFMEYGPISVVANYFFEPEILERNISPSAFFPRPKTFSALLKLTPKKRFGTVKNEKLFIAFLKSIFRYKNKNLRNALEKSWHFLGSGLNIQEDEFKQISDSLPQSDEKVSLLAVDDLVKIFSK